MRQRFHSDIFFSQPEYYETSLLCMDCVKWKRGHFSTAKTPVMYYILGEGSSVGYVIKADIFLYSKERGTLIGLLSVSLH